MSTCVVPAKLVILAIQSAGKTNRSTYYGLIILALVPFVLHAYLPFDGRAGDTTAYWNTYYFLFAVRYDVALLLCVTAAYLILPQQYHKVSILFVIFAAPYLVRIVWLPFVTSNKEFHQFAPFHMVLCGIAVTSGWFTMFDWLMNLHFHKRSRPVATMEGAAKCPDISEAQLRAIVIEETQNLKALQ